MNTTIILTVALGVILGNLACYAVYRLVCLFRRPQRPPDPQPQGQALRYAVYVKQHNWSQWVPSGDYFDNFEEANTAADEHDWLAKVLTEVMNARGNWVVEKAAEVEA